MVYTYKAKGWETYWSNHNIATQVNMICTAHVNVHVTPVSLHHHHKIILSSIIVRFGCGLFIEASVSIYSNKWLHQETASHVVNTPSHN